MNEADECSSTFTRGGLFPGRNKCELGRDHSDLHSSHDGGFFWTDADVTGELLPAEDRLANVLKAIEDRILAEQKSLRNLEDLYDLNMGHTDEEEVLNQRAFISGLDIAWSLAQSEALRRTDSTW